MMPPDQPSVAAQWSARRAHVRPLWIEGFGPHPDKTEVDGPSELVSVILPTRNRGRMTRTAIESVVAQTWPHWELLVIDDGSDDDTALVAGILADRDPRITVLRTGPRGASAARNTGLEAARGTRVAFLDSDVRWEPDVLRALMAQMHGTGADVVYANQRGLISSGARFRSPHVLLPELLLRPLLELSSVLVRRQIVEEVGGFDEDLPRGGDYDYLIRLAQRTRLQYTPVVGSEVEVHPKPYPRVSTTEPDDWIERVQMRHEVDWASQDRQFRVPNMHSLVVPIAGDVDAALAALSTARGGDDRRWEAVLVDYSEGDQVASVLAPIVEADHAVSYIRMPLPVSFEHAATIGFERTHGTSVTLVSSTGVSRVVRAADVIDAQRVRPEEH